MQVTGVERRLADAALVQLGPADLVATPTAPQLELGEPDTIRIRKSKGTNDFVITTPCSFKLPRGRQRRAELHGEYKVFTNRGGDVVIDNANASGTRPGGSRHVNSRQSAHARGCANAAHEARICIPDHATSVTRITRSDHIELRSRVGSVEGSTPAYADDCCL